MMRGRAMFLTGVAGILAACVSEERVADGPSTEAGNPALAGILRESSGLPAAGALVRLYRIPSSGDSATWADPIRLDSLRTGADGAYRFDSLPAGSTYALEGSDAARTAFAFLPAADIPADAEKGFLRRDTLVLKPPGRLHGIARRDSNPRPQDVVGEAGILVRVVGLARAAYTDSAGGYAFADIPEGTYRLHFMAADGHYLGQVAGPVQVVPGAEVELPPVMLAWSPWVAPPAPAGLTVMVDSAAGAIRLRWQRVFVSNFDHYRILRADSQSSAAPDTFRTRDTAFADTVKHLPAGRILHYRVQAVNTLGNASGNPEPRPVPVPPPGGTDPGNLEITALVLSGVSPAPALVRLYALSAAPDPEDRLPRGIALIDSAQAGADGRVRFAGRPAGAYTLVASARTGADAAARVGVSSRQGGDPDTLRLAAPGTLQGKAARGGLWCADGLKLDENIEVHLAGTPWYGVTDYDGGFAIPAVPAGDYRVAAAAVPRGCLLFDTVAAVILPGQATVLPGLAARPDPDFIPTVTGLRADPAAGPIRGAYLTWTSVPGTYPDLQGYEVIRRLPDGAGAAAVSSGVVEEPAWTDDLSGLPSGTVVDYRVRAVRKDGARGPFGGDRQEPVYFAVP